MLNDFLDKTTLRSVIEDCYSRDCISIGLGHFVALNCSKPHCAHIIWASAVTSWGMGTMCTLLFTFFFHFLLNVHNFVMRIYAHFRLKGEGTSATTRELFIEPADAFRPSYRACWRNSTELSKSSFFCVESVEIKWSDIVQWHRKSFESAAESFGKLVELERVSTP